MSFASVWIIILKQGFCAGGRGENKSPATYGKMDTAKLNGSPAKKANERAGNHFIYSRTGSVGRLQAARGLQTKLTIAMVTAMTIA